jgi:hypothetical protein
MNSMGALFNQVSLSVVTSESKPAIVSSYNAITACLLNLYRGRGVKTCGDDTCGFCAQLQEVKTYEKGEEY